MPCFNVTVSDFSLPGSSNAPQPGAPTDVGGPSSPASAVSTAGSGLKAGEKAGIAVGTILGSLTIVGILAFRLLRKKRSQPADVESPTNHVVHKGSNDAMSERSSRV